MGMHKLPCVAHPVGCLYLMFLCYIAVQQNLLAPIKKKKLKKHLYQNVCIFCVKYLFHLETTKCNLQSMLKETVKTLHYLNKQFASPASPGLYWTLRKYLGFFFTSFVYQNKDS